MDKVDAARDKLGPYCMNVCKAKCCRRGQLLLEAREARVVDETRVSDPDGYVRVPLEGGCKKLGLDSKCTIYKNRPRACREYPLYPKGKLLLVASGCEGVAEGMLDEELEGFRRDNYRVEFI